MRKISFITAAVISAALLVSCGQSRLAKQAEIQGQLSLAAKDYETARNTLKISIDDGHASESADEAYRIVDGYLKADAALSDGDTALAAELLSKIPESYKNCAAAEDIDALKSEIEKGMSDTTSVSGKITRAAKLLITQQYNEAYALLNSIDMRFITDEEAQKVQRLKDAARSASEQMKASQKLGREKAESEAAIAHARSAG